MPTRFVELAPSHPLLVSPWARGAHLTIGLVFCDALSLECGITLDW